MEINEKKNLEQPAGQLGKNEIEAYFNRIGYNGGREATAKCLRSLHQLHPQSIPFENLNPLLEIPVLLDIESLQQKLVHSGRGGYCFEHNLLFGEVLKSLGFRIKGLAARILWNMPEGTITSRGHMLLLVETAEGRYIADVGFGGLTLTAPLLLEPEIEQQTPHELFRILDREGEYTLQVKIKEVWKSIYFFSLEEQFLQDYEVTSWYLSNHPDSHFVTGLIAARSTPEGRYALMNNRLSIHRLDGITDKKEFHTVDELKRALEEIFKIRLPLSEKLETKFQHLIPGQEND